MSLPHIMMFAMKSLTILLLGAWFIPLTNPLTAQTQVNVFNEYTTQPDVWRPVAPLRPGVDANGNLNLSLPVLTIPGRNGLDFVVRFDYRSGIKGHQSASWIGLGWSFDPGSIAREVQGGLLMPLDDFYNVDYDDAAVSILPDVYYVTTPAASFSMSRATNGSEIVLPPRSNFGDFVPETWRPWVVDPHTSKNLDLPRSGGQQVKTQVKRPGNPSPVPEKDYPGFTLTAEDGTRYLFEEPTIATYVGAHPGSPGLTYSEEWYVNSWRLVAILGPDYPQEDPPSLSVDPGGSWIVFRYDVNTGVSQSGNSLNHVFEAAYVAEIETPTHLAVFTRVGRHNTEQPPALLSNTPIYQSLFEIELKAKQPSGSALRIRKVALTHDSRAGLGGNKRLTLTNIQFLGETDSDTLPGYIFDYYSMPPGPVGADNLDDFGYYNTTTSSGSPTGIDADTTEGRYWSLQSTTYPTGGRSEFTYENDFILPGSVTYTRYHIDDNVTVSTSTNAYAFTKGQNVNQGGVRVKEIWQYVDGSTQTAAVVTTYDYGNGRSSGVPEHFWERDNTDNDFYKPNSRGKAEVYYSWVKRINADSTYEKTFYTNEGSRPPGVEIPTVETISIERAGKGLTYAVGNEHMLWGLPFETRLGRDDVDGNEEDHRVTLYGLKLKEITLPLGVYPGLAPLFPATNSTVKWRMNRTRLSETLQGRVPSGSLVSLSDRTFTYDDTGPEATGLLKTIKDISNEISRTTTQTYAYEITEYNAEFEANNRLNVVVRTDVDGINSRNSASAQGQAQAQAVPGGTKLFFSADVTTWKCIEPEPDYDNICVWHPHQIYKWHEETPSTNITPPSFDWDSPTPNGSSWLLLSTLEEYDIYGNLVKQHDALGTTEFFYGNNNTCSPSNNFGSAYLTCIERYDDPQDMLVRKMGYDTRYRLASIEDSNNNLRSFTYDPFGRLEEINTSDGLVARHEYVLNQALALNEVRSTAYRSSTETTSATTYFDGLARPVQAHISEGTSTIIAVTEYDGLGRANKAWKPYRRSGSGFDGSYIQNAQAYFAPYFLMNSTFYNLTEHTTEGLSRVARVTPPHLLSQAHLIETNYSLDLVPGEPSHYSSSVTIDEDLNQSQVYTDGFGTSVYQIAGMRTEPSASLDAITAFNYDAVGQILTVWPPNYFNPPTGSSLGDWVIHYAYNTLGQLTKKSTPDADGNNNQNPADEDGETQSDFRYVYAAAGNLRFVEDPNHHERDGSGFLYTKFDEFSRVLETGVYTGSTSFDAADPDASTWPSSNTTEVVEYVYDDYAIACSQYSARGFSCPSTPSGATTLHPKERLTQIITDDSYSLYYYDAEGRVVDYYVFVSGLGGKFTEYAYDRQGNVMNIRYQQSQSDAFELTYHYDEAGRLKEVLSQASGETTPTSEATYSYLASGQVDTLTLGGLSPIEYRYHIRNWLIQINDPDDLGGNQFAMRLGYDDPAFTGAPTYENGNIGSVVWAGKDNSGNSRVLGQDSGGAFLYQAGFGFTYDALNRLLGAEAKLPGSPNSNWEDDANYHVPLIKYDPNGNITQLQRNYGTGNSHDLNYTYGAGNRLLSVTGLPGVPLPVAFDYDANGNMKKSRVADPIDYDRRNLPLSMEVETDLLTFRYDADGQRISKAITRADQSETETFYLRGGDGSVLAVYVDDGEGGGPQLQYWNILSGGAVIGRIVPPSGGTN